MTEPPSELTLRTYPDWLRNTHRIDLEDPNLQDSHELAQQFLIAYLRHHPFALGLDEFIHTASRKYRELHGSDLLMDADHITNFELKSWASLVNKSFRMNCLQNRNFPDVPRFDPFEYGVITADASIPGEWVTPRNWFGFIDDPIRARVICKFADGPDFLATKLEEYAKSRGVSAKLKRQTKDNGYYAYHCYFVFEIGEEFAVDGLGVSFARFSIELQITTQLQEILYDLTHTYYEAERLEATQPHINFSFFESHRFKSTYTGHTLYLIESILLEIRKNSQAHKTKQGPQ